MTQFSLDKGYLENFERIGVAFSGGLDSSVLLKFLSDYPEYQKKLVALHVNHGVNKESDYWEQFCKEKATKLNVEFKSWRLGELKKTSEQALREKRYEAFQEWANPNDLIISGHHLDDQIETILFRLFRGTGLKGLQGINITSMVGPLNFYRPFLQNKKEDLFDYASKHNLDWIEDYSNGESHFSRNFIRNNIIPEIQKRWPYIHKSLNRISVKATKAHQVLEEVAIEDLNRIKFSKTVLDTERLKSLSLQRQENLVLYWLNNFNNIKLSSGLENQIFSLITKPLEGSSTLNIDKHSCTSDIKIIISEKEIRVIDNNLLQPLSENMNLDWDLKGIIKISTGELSVEESYGRGIDKKFIGSNIKIKARVGGERCKPFGRSKSQKIKNLFQEFDVPDWKRDYIPIIYIEEKIAAVGDLWVCDEFHANSDEYGISIKWNHNF